MDDYPLAPFLTARAADDWTITVGEYTRVSLALQAPRQDIEIDVPRTLADLKQLKQMPRPSPPPPPAPPRPRPQQDALLCQDRPSPKQWSQGMTRAVT